MPNFGVVLKCSMKHFQVPKFLKTPSYIMLFRGVIIYTWKKDVFFEIRNFQLVVNISLQGNQTWRWMSTMRKMKDTMRDN